MKIDIIVKLFIKVLITNIVFLYMCGAKINTRAFFIKKIKLEERSCEENETN